MSVRKGNNVIAGGTVITIDTELSATSINPVQNHAITEALETKQSVLDAGSGITITEYTIAVGNLDCGTMS